MQENEDYGYLGFQQEDRQVLSNLSAMGEKLKQLQQEMLLAEAAAKTAKDAYEHYANTVIPMEMLNAGVDSISLATGGKLSVVHKYYCQPNKNPADRKIIADWLRSHNGEYLIESSATVDSSDVQRLKDNDIPFIEDTEVNTSKLKAFIRAGLGLGPKAGSAQFTKEDIPDCIHFQEVSTTELELPKE